VTSPGPDDAAEHDASQLIVIDVGPQILRVPPVDAGAVRAPDVETPRDADPSDEPTPVDQGVPDASAAVDVVVAVDVPSAVDAGAPDVSVPIDVGTRDVPVPVDAGVRDVPSVVDVPPVVDAPRPVDVPVAVDAGSPDAGTLPEVSPGLPAWDSATVAHVRELRARGVAMGNRLSVFAKIGDSITESGSFLFDVGFGWVDLGAYATLATTIQYFSATPLDGGVNSFNRSSVCATAGWTTDDALAGGNDAPLRRELAAIHPAWAIVMYGTNDVDRNTLAAFSANLNRIVDIIEAAGTVPALSTIPDRYDGSDREARAMQIDAAIRNIAAARHVPLIDYWAALQGLPMNGVSADGIHPTVYLSGGSTASGDFTASGLQYGYNVRNLTALLMLNRMRTLP
jgi:hypothetical protein